MEVHNRQLSTCSVCNKTKVPVISFRILYDPSIKVNCFIEGQKGKCFGFCTVTVLLALTAMVTISGLNMVFNIKIKKKQ